MPPKRRLWCACTIIYYLAGKPEAKPDCDLIMDQAARGEIEIMVSVLAEAEVAKVDQEVNDNPELLIREFFARPYIVRATLDIAVAEQARRLVRQYPLKPIDAVHIATALFHNVPILETYDKGMIALSEKEGDPPLIIRKPTYEGTRPLIPLDEPSSSTGGGSDSA